MVLQNTLAAPLGRDVPGSHESWTLSPSVARVEYLDGKLRSRLIDSFRHIAGCGGLGDDSSANLMLLEGRLGGSSVSPWVFCLYSKLVAELSKGVDERSIVSDIITASSLPAGEAVVSFRDPTIPPSWWDHFVVLLDTDSARTFSPQTAVSATFALCKREVEEGLSLLRIADARWYDEVRHLLRLVVVGSAPLDTEDLFNGTSTFFFWGGSLINAEARRSAVSIIDLLIHESSHLLLFGLSAEGPLLNNKGEERYSSPLRSDPRPIDGILHACFVSSRVHLAMNRLLDSGILTVKNEKRAAERRAHNARSARIALEVLKKHARPTELGKNVLESLCSYWSGAALQ
jgi:hypothetical protein